MQLVVGIGCDRGASLQTLEQAIALALQSAGLSFGQVELIATTDQKSDEWAILTLAKQRQWRLRFYPTSLLAQANTPNRVEVVMKYLGAACVSQAAVVLAANSHSLLVEEFKYCGVDGKNATISVAQLSE
jgi:cobalt-precorrin 5A hydrolase